MKDIDSLPVPKWLVKGKKLEFPNGTVLSFVVGTILIKWLDAQGVFEFKKRL